MATSPVDVCNTAHIRGDGNSIPLSFLLCPGGSAEIQYSRLASRFGFKEESVHVELDVMESGNTVVSHSIAQIPVVKDGVEVWFLKLGRYCVYGSHQEDLQSWCLNPLPSTPASVTNVIPLLHKVKIECLEPVVIDLSDDSDKDVQSKQPLLRSTDFSSTRSSVHSGNTF